MAGYHTRHVTEQDFQTAVLQRSREVPVVVDFWASWCEPCKVLDPILEKVASELDGAFELAKVDVDANQALAGAFRVQGIPTVIAFKDGKEASRFTGAYPEDAVRSFVTALLPTELDLMVDQARTALIEGDDTTAEHLFRQVLEQKADHGDAATGLAALLIDRGDTDEALVVLGKLVPDAEVERLQAAARLRATAGGDIDALGAAVAEDPENDMARIELAKALAARSEYEPALDHLLAVVRKKGAAKDEARKAMVDVFGVLGDDHPLTVTYRRQLASALY
jgi:putative thioredoxin